MAHGSQNAGTEVDQSIATTLLYILQKTAPCKRRRRVMTKICVQTWTLLEKDTISGKARGRESWGVPGRLVMYEGHLNPRRYL